MRPFELPEAVAVLCESEMNPDALFEKFPDVVLSSFREKMLLGKVSAEAVQRVLEPLLSNFHEIMLQLSPGSQADFENILRIYPEVAERAGVRISPPLVESLRHIVRHRLKQSSTGRLDDVELDMAAEPQQRPEVTNKSLVRSLVKEGQGFFTTDRGSPVYIEFFYSEEDDCATFEYKPARFNIEIHICGICATTLTPGRPKERIPVDGLCQILINCAREVEIKILELP